MAGKKAKKTCKNTQANEIRRVVVGNVRPMVDNGDFPVKRVVGETVRVTADVFADGHDKVGACLLYREGNAGDWTEIPMSHEGNDVWTASFRVNTMEDHYFTVEGWIDRFGTWQSDMVKKIEADKYDDADKQAGMELIREAVSKVPKRTDKAAMESILATISGTADRNTLLDTVSGSALTEYMGMYDLRLDKVRFGKDVRIVVEREKALFSTWYEMFPRSCAAVPGKHGTFRDCENMLPEIEKKGFDVLYLPPVHPIGLTKRKGRNNSPESGPGDVGSPWAIGSSEGGHTAINPALGTLKDLKRLMKKAGERGIEVAMDLAFQCSPDHPYVKEHPEWFRWRADGTIQYAENPPKKYEDIVPLDFESDDMAGLWEELRDVVFFWMDNGVRIFRVDNPHTKPFNFWQWLISEARAKDPGIIFLAEAFTRPKIMKRLAKAGFSQSYTYFTWRNTKSEFTEYMKELTLTDCRDYMRPNFWTNTPDILPEHLQYGGRPAFIVRLILAATLSSNYGMYGPAFELCVNEAVPGKEEYKDSEKYEIKNWDLKRTGNISRIVQTVNRIRRQNRALHDTWNLRFADVDNDQLLFYVKATEDLDNVILVVVNLDLYHTQSGWINVPLGDLGLDENQPYLVNDLLSGDKYIWTGSRNYVQLDPHVFPAHVLKLRRRLKSERDFDYYT